MRFTKRELEMLNEIVEKVFNIGMTTQEAKELWDLKQKIKNDI